MRTHSGAAACYGLESGAAAAADMGAVVERCSARCGGVFLRERWRPAGPQKDVCFVNPGLTDPGYQKFWALRAREELTGLPRAVVFR